MVALDLDAYLVDFDVMIPLSGQGDHLVEFRLVDRTGSIFSDLFVTSTVDIGVTEGPGIYGTLVYDVNRDGSYTAGESPLAGWTVSIVTPEGNPAPAEVVIDPDNYNHQTQLNQIVDGVTLSAFGSGIASTWDFVMARDSQFSSTGVRSFHNYDSTNNWNHLWSLNRRLRIDLDEAVGRIAIDAIGVNSNSRGRLEAFDAEGNLLGTYSTGAMNSGVVETMWLERNAPDIAYVIVAGHQSASGLQGTIALDNLRIGRPATAVTNDLGGFHLPFHLSGDFKVQLTPPESEQGKYSFPSPITYATTAGEIGGSLPLIAWTNAETWHNPVNPVDVLEDNQVGLADIDALIGEMLNSQFSSLTGGARREFTQAHEVGLPFLDVNNNGYLNPGDLTALVNAWLMQQEAISDLAPEPGGTSVSFLGSPGSGDSAGDGQPDGEPEAVPHETSHAFELLARIDVPASQYESFRSSELRERPSLLTSSFELPSLTALRMHTTIKAVSAEANYLSHPFTTPLPPDLRLGLFHQESPLLAEATDVLLADDELEEWLLPGL